MKDMIRIYGAFALALFILMGIGFSNLSSFIDIPSLQFVLGGSIAGLALVFGSRLNIM